MTWIKNLLNTLDFYDQVESAIITPMIRWLLDGRKPDLLDAGCGSGVPAVFFAESGCRVTGIDIDTTDLQHAARLAASTGLSSRLSFVQGDLMQLPFEGELFELVWSSYVLHHIADKQSAVHELHRVLKPNGRLAIREDGLPIQCLPFDIGIGEPGFQDRLRVANNRWFAAMTNETLPNATHYPFGWSQLLVDGGFKEITARTFTIDAVSPLDRAYEEFVLHYFQRTLDRDGAPYGIILSPADRDTLQELLNPNSEHYVLNRRDLHLRYGLSIYVGKK